jgi:hypothetical protein
MSKPEANGRRNLSVEKPACVFARGAKAIPRIFAVASFKWT